jgi:hypothetical protein
MPGRLNVFFMVLMAPLVLCTPLGGCAVDAYSSFPALLRQKPHDTARHEDIPAVAAIVREQLDSIFLANSSPHNVQVSPAHRDPRDLDWIACVKADVTSATGRIMESPIYRITIAEDKIVDRRRSDDQDNCLSESYQPI